MDFIDWNPKTSLKIYIKKGMVENHQSMIKKLLAISDHSLVCLLRVLNVENRIRMT